MFLVLNNSYPFLFRCIPRRPNQIFRKCSILTKLRAPPILLDKSNYKIICEYPNVRHAALLLRSKTIVPLCATICSPLIFFYGGNEITVFSVLGLGALHFLILHLVINRFPNIIGKIYVNKDGNCQEVVISCLGSTGNRIDRLHNVDDIIVCDYSSKLQQQLGIFKIMIQGTDIAYHIQPHNMVLRDPKTCMDLFQGIWNVIIKEKADSDS